MSNMEEAFNGHQLHSTLANLESALENERLVSDKTNVIVLVDRISTAASYCKSCLGLTLANLISERSLNNANTHVQNILNEVNNFNSNDNEGHLINASGHVDSLLAELRNFPIESPPIAGKSFTAALGRFKTQIEKALQSVVASKSEFSLEIEELKQIAEKRKAELRNLEEKVSQNSKMADDTLANLNSQLSSQKDSFEQRLNNLIESNKETQEAFLNNQEEQFEASRTRSEEAYKSERSSQKSQFDSAIEVQQKAASKVLSELSSKLEEASNIVQIIGNIGITGNYQNVANIEKESADKWRNYAIALMLGMVLVIGLTIGITTANGFDWRLALFRIGAALALAIPATYAARESNKHRQRENYNRQAELELASLDPFLEKLPKEVQDKIKGELTTKFFGLNLQENDSEEITKTSLLDIIKSGMKK